MTQFNTTRSIGRYLPGHVLSPKGAGNEPESLEVPYVLQSFTLTVSAAPDPVAAGDYIINVITPVDGTVQLTVTAAGTETPAEFAAMIAAAGAADPILGGLFYWTSAANVVTIVAKSAKTNIATPTFEPFPGATTIIAAVLTPPGSTRLPMGRFYVYQAPQASLAITGTPRGRQVAALPDATTTLAQLRGVVARPRNQTELSANFDDGAPGTEDAYRAGQIAFGAMRGEVCCVVDPASPTITDALDQELYVVIAANDYSVIGSVVGAPDAIAANTIRIDNAPAGNILGRVVMTEDTYALGGTTVRLVAIKVNRTN